MTMIFKLIKRVIIRSLKKLLAIGILYTEQEYEINRRITYVPSFRIDGKGNRGK